jgi:predicted SAM-dependent methyltransferase
MNEVILNLGAGKLLPLDVKDPNFIINIDTGYFGGENLASLGPMVGRWIDEDRCKNRNMYLDDDVFKVLNGINFQADRIVAYRFLEHIPENDVLSSIYQISTALKIGGTLDIIVPNYKTLANMLLNEKVLDVDFLKHNITLTYELLNEPSCPHASIWTRDRVDFFFTYEGRFRIKHLVEDYEFDGRDIYLRFMAERIK